MKLLFFILSIVALASCAETNKPEDNNIQFGAYLNTKLEIAVHDSLGNNLLKDSTSGHYNYDDIKTFTFENNRFQEDLGLDLAKSKRIGYSQKGNLEIYLSNPTFNECSATISSYYKNTYIKFGQLPYDTIRGHFSINKNKGYCNLDTVYYNSKRIYVEDSHRTSYEPPVIVKALNK